MKINHLIIVMAILLAARANAQLKVHTGGSVSYGSTTAPGGGEKHKFTGDVVVTSATGVPTSALRLRGNNGYSGATTPDFTWYGDDHTGLFHPNDNFIGFSIGGAEAARITNYGNLLMGSTSAEYAKINTVTSGYGGIYCKTTYGADWGLPIIDAQTDRSNSVTYRSGITGGSNTFWVAGAGYIYSQGNYLGSDKNIKDDIKAIDSATFKLSKIKGVTYKLKKEKQNPGLYGTANEYMGVIAQDVEAVAPQAVKTFQDGTKGVCYEMLVGLLIEALKEQNSKIIQLENDVNNCCSKTNERTITPGTIENTESGQESYIKQNSPNPFSKETVIDYFIAEKNANSSILIFDMNGKLLKTLRLSGTGKGSVTINGNDFQPGMYYYSLIVNTKEIDTKKMILTEN